MSVSNTISGSQASVLERIDLFYKKSQGIPYAYPESSITNEPGLNARQRIFPSKQLFSDDIPNKVSDTDLSSTIVDVSYGGVIVGTYRVHNNFSYIKKYIKLKLKSIKQQRSYYFIGTDRTNYTTNLLMNAIPYNYDESLTYSPVVEIDNSPKNSDSGDRQWYLDPDAGILTFYDDLLPTEDDKVTITFWRYEGRFGFQTVATNAPKLIFDGGTPNTNFNQGVGNVVVISGGGVR